MSVVAVSLKKKCRASLRHVEIEMRISSAGILSREVDRLVFHARRRRFTREPRVGELFMQALFFFPAEDGIRGFHVTGVQTCALPICRRGVVEPEGDEIGPGCCREYILKQLAGRSEERRVGKECRSRWSAYH